MKYVVLALVMISAMSGCSATKINENVDTITSDVTGLVHKATKSSE